MPSKNLKKFIITALTALALFSGSGLAQANDVQKPAPRVWVATVVHQRVYTPQGILVRTFYRELRVIRGYKLREIYFSYDKKSKLYYRTYIYDTY
ncbi:MULTISPECIES: hypothetical protein [Lactococcus]|uniref:hypothetical protein n=1 Tax=Lactococcus TaxID=1357 RepID=UPI001923F516|nr:MULTISPECIES: hypothetical protein [Lactococcus]MBL3716585.1 hypothetical protein [Lactococcus garvieae]